MNVVILAALGNVVVWGVIVGLLFLLTAGERALTAELTELERRLGDHDE